jgi:hypothetical protein
MKHSIYDLGLVLGRLDRRHVQLALAILGLVLFVLGAGAPDVGGGTGG